MGFLQKANCLIDRATIFDHVKWARLGNERSVKAGILAREVEFTDDGSARSRFRFLTRGIFFSVSENERKKKGSGGQTWSGIIISRKHLLVPGWGATPPVDSEAPDQ
jgi:hypothetical protein